jgi:hypothetical protein
MVRNLLVIQVPDAGDERIVASCFRPIDCFFLSIENTELVVRVIFDYIILNGRPLRSALGAGFYVNVGHSFFSLTFFIAKFKLHEDLIFATCYIQHTSFIVATATFLLRCRAIKAHAAGLGPGPVESKEPSAS